MILFRGGCMRGRCMIWFSGGGGHKLYKRANQKTNEAVIFLPQIDPELMKSAHDDEECIDSSIP